MTYRSLRRLLVCSASVLALQIGIGLTSTNAADLDSAIVPLPPEPWLFLSLEGGAACSFGDRGTFTATSNPSLSFPAADPATASARFGGKDCGGTGRIGVFQEGPGILFGKADYWGMFLRHSWTGKDSFAGFAETYSYEYNEVFSKYYYNEVEFTGSFKEERTVIDFEVGKDIGIGQPEGNVRFFGGLRYARNTDSLKASGSTDFAKYTSGPEAFSASVFSMKMRHRFDGIGPRIGVSGRQPLAQQVSLVFSGSASALWGRHKIDVVASVLDMNDAFSDSDHGWVTNLEGEAGLSFQFSPGGAELTGGVRAEAWFGQSKPANMDFTVTDGETISSDLNFKGKLDRHNWGPFVRLTVPLGP